METSSVANLVFNTSLDKKRVIRVPDPQPSLNSSIVEMIAGTIIVANPFDETIGTLVSLANAERITTNRIVLI